MSAMYSKNGMIIRKNDNFNVIGGKKYKTIKMPDGKIWLAENLDFKFCNVGGSGTPTTPNAWYYDNDGGTYGWNGYKCGLLYNWYAVRWLEDHKSELCPGWHVPTRVEWEALATGIGGVSTAGTKLKALDNSVTIGFPNGWNGTDDYGFDVLPSGYYNKDDFNYIGDCTYFWTLIESESESNKAYHAYFDKNAGMYQFLSEKDIGFPLRLVRDSN